MKVMMHTIFKLLYSERDIQIYFVSVVIFLSFQLIFDLFRTRQSENKEDDKKEDNSEENTKVLDDEVCCQKLSYRFLYTLLLLKTK